MLKTLSARYQKYIAAFFIDLFFLSGFAAAEMKSAATYNSALLNYRNSSAFRIHTMPRDNFSGIPAADSPDHAKKKFRHIPETGVTSSPAPVFIKKISGDIGGPSQPEMATFKPVGADNMVSPFTGDFSYNIPLLDVGGYPVNMFYSSGITMDQDASWVGLGWNINPGTITRNMRGVPDDFNGKDEIIKRQSIRPDKTWGVSGGAGVKFAGIPLSLDASLGLSFNNKLGVAAELGIHPALSISTKGADKMTSGLSYGASLGAELNLNSRNGASITPSISFDITNHDNGDNHTGSVSASYTYSSRLGLEGMHLNAGLSQSLTTTTQGTDNEEPETSTRSGDIATLSSHLSFLYPTITPSIQNIFTRKAYSLSFSAGGELWGLNAHGRIAGYYNESYIADEDKETHHPAFGILHYQEAAGNESAMLDFNRVNDGPYTPSSPAIAMPLYTYDIFNITGEGTGGSFRAYRGDIGYMHDARVVTKDNSDQLSLDIGFGDVLHAGADFTNALSPTEVNAWTVNNTATSALKFHANSGKYQAVYFKNPGEKTVPDAGFQEAVANEDLIRLQLINAASGTPMLVPKLLRYNPGLNPIGFKSLTEESVKKENRDKRTQVVSFLTAGEADRIGFDKKIYSYDSDPNKVIFSSGCNNAGITSINRVDNTHLDHHISEIDVLGTDGRKYVYGIPVYNIEQRDYSFSTGSGSASTGQCGYDAGDDNSSNLKGRDHFLQEEITPPYAHSFLLTELVSPNYVDVTGDGITEDDMGDAVKFNYSKYNGLFRWRTPSGSYKASYSEGLKTEPLDDKAHYVYGTREKWLLYSIESKNMVARFFVKDDRKDAREVLDSMGGINAASGMQRLDKICLYSKGDLAKFPNGVGAKPIKTIQFFQSYDLCPGTESSIPGYGKLTLDSIWITYNGNMKLGKTRYLFSYPKAINNPPYDFNANDRWGNFKPASENPTATPAFTNADFPYSTQVQADADKNAAAWTMNQIILPSGGQINIDYESDDYAYVQDKRAADMFSILGFGTTNAPNLNDPAINRLYNGSTDNNYVYVKLPYQINVSDPAAAKKELAARYFENTSQLFMKLSVVMPSGGNIPGSAGSEMIPVYADIQDYGLVSQGVAWVQVKPLSNGVIPMVQEPLQFLKEQLPGKAFPGYDMNEQSGTKAIVLALAGMISSLGELFNGVDGTLRDADKCSQTELSRCFARLSNPYLKKLGGGLRVKRVTIKDNWNKMTNQYDATYGQEYKYTTTALINYNPVEISSGVACWEPSVGGDENPHKQVMRFLNHNKGGPYDFGAIETPLGEALYPTPMVGYSRVEVLSIHRDNIKNPPTRQVTEFYTTKDFPFKSSCTSLADPSANVKYEPSAILQLLHLDMHKAVTQSQGFLVDMNDMNGKEKSQSIYSALDAVNPVSSTTNYYNIQRATDNTYKFNHIFPVIESAKGDLTNELIGRDIEVMADFRQHESQTITTNISPNIDFFFLGVFPIPLTNLLQPTIRESTTYRSASLLKIVNHYGMLDSVVSIDKGSMVSTKNMVYDAETGNPIITRTNNEHNKPIYNFSYPAHWAYSGMGGAYQNIDANFGPFEFRHGRLPSGNDVSAFESMLESGDELYALTVDNNSPISQLLPCDNNVGTDPWSTLAANSQRRIWAVNTSKVNSITPQWVFMDKDGNPYNGVNVYVRTVRSGHRNMLDQTAGSITSMSSPIVNGQLLFNDATNIIQTAAATFKDHWRVDNSFMLKDSLVRTDAPLPVHKRSFNGISTLNILSYHCKNDDGDGVVATGGKDYFQAEQSAAGAGWHEKFSKEFLSSWVTYDFNSVPADATVVAAKINLVAHAEASVPPNVEIAHNVNPPPCIANGTEYINHNAYNAHTYYSECDNSFKISRVIKDWSTNPSGNEYWWNDYMKNPANTDPDGQSGYGAISGNRSFTIDSYCNDQRLDITKIVSNMLHQRTMADVLRIELIHNLGYNASNFMGQQRPARVCFNTPSVDVYYYSCAEPNPQPDDATVCQAPAPPPPPPPPPAGGQSVQGPSNNFGTSGCSTCFPQFYCTTYAHHLFCLSKFTAGKSINPYVEGVLGNWRVDSTYAYYGARKESSTDNTVDTRTGGTIINFGAFWNFAATAADYLTRNHDADNVWQWNSTITQYNRKGYEIENKDPLGRFNCGLYGYNQQLPIAVTNNARLRETLFDGFEDYNYNTAQNCIACKPHHYFNYDQAITTHIDPAQHHTGIYSLRVDANSAITINAPVVMAAQADNGYALRIRVDSTYTQTPNNGAGLKAEFYNVMNCVGPPVGSIGDLSPNFNSVPFVAGLHANNISAKWSGKILAPQTGYYTFHASAFSDLQISIGGTVVLNTDFGVPGAESGTLLMYAGVHDIVIQYQKLNGNGSNVITWSGPGLSGQPVLSNNYLYSPTNLYTITNALCARLDSVNVRGSALTDTFSLIAGQKMLVSAWVKEGGNDCKCSSYTKNGILITYPGSGPAETIMRPAGSIIEGWQRYEGIFNIPGNAASVSIALKNETPSSPVYFDDIRVQPFNANMKSFVYDPSTLRLTGELDENNYASFYEYDNDGTLTRVKKETVQGIKTITETRSAMQQVINQQ